VGADLSRVVIEQMKIKCADYPQIKFFQGTITDTDLPETSVDAIIDKALLDSLLCSDTGTFVLLLLYPCSCVYMCVCVDICIGMYVDVCVCVCVCAQARSQ
jgi:hypothetical protein